MVLIPWQDSLLDLLACPRCRAPVAADASGPDGGRFRCINEDCAYRRRGFPVVDGQPALIDFDASIIDEAGLLRRAGGSVQQRDIAQRSLGNRARRLLLGGNPVARDNARRFVDEARRIAARPRVLAIGGGTIGSGAQALYEAPDLDLVSIDIFASPFTTLIGDGHHLPFRAESFEGVWIQAVLEHVLDPNDVVAEIRRVLIPGGIVYADTPFMQPVHEGAYDFTRFSHSGHRWLFRNFELMASGAVGGAGTSLNWSLKYFVRSVTGSTALGTAVSLAFFWLRFFDRVGTQAMNADAAAGVYFLGRKSEASLSARDMPAFYEGRHAQPAPARPPPVLEPSRAFRRDGGG